MYRFLLLCVVTISLAGSASAATWYVDETGSGSGTSWADAAADIQTAVDAAFADGGGELWVAAGDYTATTDPVLTLKAGVEVYGGFAGAETARDQRDWTLNISIINGEDSRRCVVASDNATLDGFTVHDGNILGHGGGMLIDSVSPTVSNCIFSSNSNSGTGLSGGRGGAIYLESSSAIITQCSFLQNYANGGGGGIYTYLGDPFIANCYFEENETASGYTGGGAYNSESAAEYHNCIFYKNTAFLGGGVGGYQTSTKLINCTITKNTATYSSDCGAGVYNNNNAGMTVTNCIISHNTPDFYQMTSVGGDPTVTYTMIPWSPYPGTGNINGPARYVNVNGGNLRLNSTSSLIDAGTNAAVLSSTDIEGKTRIIDTVDMGAYEFFIVSVSSVSPVENALNVSAATTVSATINADLETVSASSKIFTLSSASTPFLNGQNLALSYDDSDPFVLSLTPNTPFCAGERVFANLFSDDFDVKPYCWEFRVAVDPASMGEYYELSQVLAANATRAIALGDLDDDGDLDAFVANYSQGNRVWLNDGAGFLTDSGQSLGSSQSNDVVLGDTDGDGDLDALIANGSGGNKLWLNNGSAVFSNSGQTIDYNVGNAVGLLDVDGDGDLDAFIASNSTNRLWYNENGAFSDSGHEVGGYSNSVTVDIGDLDGDGMLDYILLNDFTDGEVGLNDGNASFNGVSVPGATAISYDVALGDLDADGDLDAFLATASGDRVWLNDGAGNFSDSGQSLGTTASRSVALADVDGDGDLDAFIAKSGSNANEVWINNGSATFINSMQSLGSSASYAVALGDLDGDGTIDAFVGNNAQSNKVWRNSPAPAVSSSDATNISLDAATLNGAVLSDGAQPTTERGFYYSENPIDTSNLAAAMPVVVTPDPGALGAFSAEAPALMGGTTYYFVAYATSSAGTAYSAEFSFTTKRMPVITWNDPAPIPYGTALDATQLNATADTAGAFVYNPAAGAVLDFGPQVLETTFTPDDLTLYVVATASVNLTVEQAAATVTEWPTASEIVYGQSLADSILSGGVSTPSEGLFTFDAPATQPDAGSFNAAVTFTPDSPSYTAVSGSVTVSVAKAEATVLLDDLTHSYDGTPKSASVSTTPAGLTVVLTYNGASALPVESGEYLVLATVDEANYSGSATDTLIIIGTVQESMDVAATLGQELCLTVTEPGMAGDGDFSWTFTPVDGSLSPVPDEFNATLCIENAQESDAGSYTVTYNSTPSTLNTLTFAVTVERGVPFAGMSGIAAIGALFALGGAVGLRRKKD